MHPQSAPLVCTTVEFALLAGLAGIDTLIGVPDPFAGWLAAEVEEAWAEARKSLAERGLITVHPDDAVTLEPHIAELLSTCGFPQAILSLTRTEPGQPPVIRHVHIRGERATQLHVSPEGTCEIGMLPGLTAMSEFVLSAVQPGAGTGPVFPAGTVPEAVLRQAAAAGVTPGVRESLMQAGLEADTADALAETLAGPVANCAVMLTSQQDGTWTTNGFGLLEGEKGLWLLRSVTGTEGNLVMCEACTAAGLTAEIAQLLSPVLGAPAGQA